MTSFIQDRFNFAKDRITSCHDHGQLVSVPQVISLFSSKVGVSLSMEQENIIFSIMLTISRLEYWIIAPGVRVAVT